MNKLLKLKKWVSVGDAARHLAILLGEKVGEADMIRLALDGHITLSVRFVNAARGYLGKVVPKGLAQWETVPSFDGLRTVDIPQGIPLNDGAMIELSSEISNIEGLWDLPLIGAEALDVECRFQQLTDGPKVTMVHLDGAFVRSGDVWCQLQEQDARYPPAERPFYLYPAGALPDDAVLVFRTAELARLQSELSKAEDVERTPGAPLAPRAEATYLTIIGALLELVRSPRPGRDSDASVIRELIENYSDKPGISKATLETKFADARRRLHST